MTRCLVLALCLGLAGCASAPTAREAEAAKAQIEDIARRAGVAFERIEVVPEALVRRATADTSAREILEAAAIVSTTPEGDPTVVRPYPRGTPPIREFRDAGLITRRDRVFKVTWQMDGLGSFDVLATADADGELKFEPVTYFTPVFDASPPDVTEGSWTAKHTARVSRLGPNGQKQLCGILEWQVRIETQACDITDAPPHITTSRCAPLCPGYSMACSQGEAGFCRANPECPACGELDRGEECIRYAHQAVVATGGASLGLQNNPTGADSADISGIPVDRRIIARNANRGSVSRKTTLGTLCALSGRVTRPGGELAFQFEDQAVMATGQKLAVVGIGHSPGGCQCSKVVFVQTIKKGNGPVRIDVDPNVTGVDTPFYNYDPATGKRVPNPGLGEPGSCTAGQPTATLRDVPQQTNEPVEWEVCALCCDDGTLLDCRKWTYDPRAPNDPAPDGTPRRGRYFDGGRIDSFSPAARNALRQGANAYAQRNPGAANDPCLQKLQGL